MPNLSYSQKNASVEFFIEEAIENNPEILAAKRAYEAANARIWQAASLNDPMVELEYDKMTRDRMDTGDPMKSYAISQEVPFPTKIFLRAKIASKMAKVAYQECKAKERDIVAQTKSAYSDLFRIYKTIEVTNENKGILEQFSTSTTARYSTGLATQADALKAQVEIAKIDNQLIMLEQKRLTAQARLNVLTNKDPRNEIGILDAELPVDFSQTLEVFYEAAKENNPELKAYKYAIEKGKAAYSLSVNEFMPDFTVKFRQMVKDNRVDQDAWAGMLGVTVPLWFMEKQVFGVKEMKAELSMLEAGYKAKENMVLFDVRDAYARVEANKKIVELYETAFIPQANETQKAATRGYESGKTDFLTLLDAQRMLIDFKIDRYMAILEFRIALADLEKAAGTDLNKIKGNTHEKE